MNSKIISAVTLATLLAASAGIVASAQTAPAEGTTTAPAVVEAQATDATPQADDAAVRTGVVDDRDHDGARDGRGGHGKGGDIVRGILSQADADADGSVTQAEIDALRATLVGSADVSGEGDLSLDEFQTVYLQLVRPQMVDAFQNLDEDGDATVTAAELDTRLNGLVEHMDQDGDGALSSTDGHGRRG